MLKSYEAIYKKGQIKWLDEKPSVIAARIIITILEERPSGHRRRIPSSIIAGKVKTIGDILKPVVDAEDWKCLK